MAYLEVDEEGEMLDSPRLRARGLRRERGAQIERRFGKGDAEPDLRAALKDLVDAFLVDRPGQRDLFSRAHRLGRDLSGGYGCRYEYSAAEDRYTVRCPIFALHQPVALSVAWTLITSCSICSAGAFDCDHIAGNRYGDEVCEMAVEEITGLGHIAWTANPDFLYTWHQPHQHDGARLLAEGRIDHLGQELPCLHCERCGPGLIGPGEGDLDPVTRWRKIVAERRPAAEG